MYAAQENLAYLVEAGLVSDPDNRIAAANEKLRPVLPSDTPQPALRDEGVYGGDGRFAVAALPDDALERRLAQAVGTLRIYTERVLPVQCTALMVDGDKIMTADFCVDSQLSSIISIDFESEVGGLQPVQIEPLEVNEQFGFVILQLREPSARRPHEDIVLSDRDLQPGEPLFLVMASGERTFVSRDSDCAVQRLFETYFYHLCDTGRGSSGAPIFSQQDMQVVGLHYGSYVGGRVNVEKTAKSMQSILAVSKLLSN